MLQLEARREGEKDMRERAEKGRKEMQMDTDDNKDDDDVAAAAAAAAAAADDDDDEHMEPRRRGRGEAARASEIPGSAACA